MVIKEKTELAGIMFIVAGNSLVWCSLTSVFWVSWFIISVTGMSHWWAQFHFTSLIPGDEVLIPSIILSEMGLSLIFRNKIFLTCAGLSILSQTLNLYFTWTILMQLSIIAWLIIVLYSIRKFEWSWL